MVFEVVVCCGELLGGADGGLLGGADGGLLGGHQQNYECWQRGHRCGVGECKCQCVDCQKDATPESEPDVLCWASWSMHRTVQITARVRARELVATMARARARARELGLAVSAVCPSGDVALAVGPALMVVYLIIGAIGPAGVSAPQSQSQSPGTGSPSMKSLSPTSLRVLSPMIWACKGLLAAEFQVGIT
ncbi:hypothetical protein B484DRAFT_392029 [Ochromonadaceae sp. CCMP2298]|nr:hypothetical protein B484DRAFT_392029 [Ochromonadaceae sp. CCMP2298]